MDQKEKNIVAAALASFENATGLKAAHHPLPPNEDRASDGLITIDHQGICTPFALEVKKSVSRITVAAKKTEIEPFQEKHVLITDYVTPPIADLLKKMDLCFIDAAGNAFINEPPLYVFIKGNKTAKQTAIPQRKRLFQPSGLRVVFALLNNPNMVNMPYRDIAGASGVALGTVGWIFQDLRESGFLLEVGKRQRKLVDLSRLLRRWVESYPEQLRPKRVIDRFETDHKMWWENVSLSKHGALWSGEVAAAKLTGYLKPEQITIYAHEPPAGLIIRNRLRKASTGTIEILKPFWNFDTEFAARGIAPPLLVYADLLAAGNSRNIEAAKIIYDRYLAQIDG